MPGPAASATSVGAGSPRGGGTSSPRAGGGGGARQRKGTSSSGAVRTTRAGGTSSGGMWRFYTDDSPGIKVIMICSYIYDGIELSVRINSLNITHPLHSSFATYNRSLIYSLFAGRPRARAGDVAAVHRLRLHAPHLGEVQQSLGPQQQT